MALLDASGLSKRLGRREVVSGVSISLEAGEVFGFLGPNGAGKTTTIRILTGLVRPDSGSVTICGFDLRRRFEEALSHVGAIIESPDLYRFLTGRENLAMFARMLGGGAEREIVPLARLVGMDSRLDDRVSTYSLGMRQRLGIAQALLGRPRVLILDEPANGLDPAGIREIRGLLRGLARDRAMAVFVSSHLLAEVEQLCDRVAILHRGRILAVERVETLLAGRSRLRIRTDDSAAASSAVAGLSEETRVVSPTEIDTDLPEASVPEAVRRLSSAGVAVFEVTRVRPALEDLFLELTHGETVG